MDPSYQPWTLFSRALEGDLDGALRDPGLFKCVECYECHELCYQRWGMVHGLRALKHLAIERGLAPEAVTAGVDSFLRTGLLTRPSGSRRAKLGLPEARTPGTEELQKLLGVEAEAGAPAKRKGPAGSRARRRAKREGE